MTDLNVALRLSLINQMRSGAEAAKRDLEKIRAAADRTGKTQSAATIRAGQAARQAELAEIRKAAAATRSSAAYRRQRAELLAGSMAAEHVARRQEVRQAREAARVRRDARSSQVALAAAASAGRKIEWAPAPDIQLNAKTPRGGAGGNGNAGVVTAAVAAERARLAAEANAAREEARKKTSKGKGSGGGGNAANTAIAAGAGAGFARTFLGGLAAGVSVAGIIEVAKRTIAGAAADEFERSQLMVSGNLSPAQMEAHRKLLGRTARLRGIGAQATYGVFGGLMDAGFSDTDAAALTDNLVVFAKANRLATEEATSLTAALKTNMKIATSAEMMTAYDSISRGGKSGMSPADLSRYLPSALAKAHRLGEQGVTGLRNTVALLQGIRRGVGDSREALTGFEAMVDQISNPTFIKRAGKFGINIEKTIRDANKNGVSPLFAVLQEIDRKTKGDPLKLGKLGLNKNAIAAFNALLKDSGYVLRAVDDMAGSAGQTMKEYTTATNNATEAWERLSASIGDKAKELATDVLPGLTRAMDLMTQQLERTRTQKTGGDYEAPEEATPEEKEWVKKEKEKAKRIDDWFGKFTTGDDSVNAKRREQMNQLKSELGFNVVEREDERGKSRERRVEAYREYARTRIEGVHGRFADDGTPMPSPAPRGDIPVPTPAPRTIQKMLDGMDLRAREAAEAAMGSYKQAMGTGLEETRSIVAAAVAEFKEMLNFTATPTITPHVATAAVAAGAGVPGSGGGRGGGSANNVSVTQNISSPNSRVAAARAKREQNREVRHAMANSLHDMGLA